MTGRRDVFHYLECSECGTLSLQDPPKSWELYYSDTYYSYAPTSKIKLWIKRQRNAYELQNGNPLGSMFAKVFGESPLVGWIKESGAIAKARVVDVGCGSGQMLRELQGCSFQSLLGIDPFMKEEFSSGTFSLRRMDPMKFKGPCDLIMMHHSFEHVMDPTALLGHLAQQLSADGRMIIRIPVADSWAWQTYGTDWVQLDPPRHTFLLTGRSMQQMALKSGLEIFHKSYDSDPIQIWGSELYKQNIPLLDPRSPWVNPKSDVFTEEAMQSYRAKVEELNKAGQGDQAVFYLRKAPS